MSVKDSVLFQVRSKVVGGTDRHQCTPRLSIKSHASCTTAVLEEKLSHSKHARESLSFVVNSASGCTEQKLSADYPQHPCRKHSANLISKSIPRPCRRNVSSEWDPSEFKNATVHIILRSRNSRAQTASSTFLPPRITSSPHSQRLIQMLCTHTSLPIASPSYLCLANASPLPAPHCYQYA